MRTIITQNNTERKLLIQLIFWILKIDIFDRSVRRDVLIHIRGNSILKIIVSVTFTWNYKRLLDSSCRIAFDILNSWRHSFPSIAIHRITGGYATVKALFTIIN